jgi:hypothetical protein
MVEYGQRMDQMPHNQMTKLEKLQHIQRILELLTHGGESIPMDDIDLALIFVKDFIDSYTQDFK